MAAYISVPKDSAIAISQSSSNSNIKNAFKDRTESTTNSDELFGSTKSKYSDDGDTGCLSRIYNRVFGRPDNQTKRKVCFPFRCCKQKRQESDGDPGITRPYSTILLDVVENNNVRRRRPRKPTSQQQQQPTK